MQDEPEHDCAIDHIDDKDDPLETKFEAIRATIVIELDLDFEIHRVHRDDECKRNEYHYLRGHA